MVQFTMFKVSIKHQIVVSFRGASPPWPPDQGRCPWTPIKVRAPRSIITLPPTGFYLKYHPGNLVAPTRSITNIIWTYGSRSPRHQHQIRRSLPTRKYDVILYSLSPLKRCCLLPKLRQAELAWLRLQHHLLERSYMPFQCLQLVPVLTTHPCALPCLVSGCATEHAA